MNEPLPMLDDRPRSVTIERTVEVRYVSWRVDGAQPLRRPTGARIFVPVRVHVEMHRLTVDSDVDSSDENWWVAKATLHGERQNEARGWRGSRARPWTESITSNIEPPTWLVELVKMIVDIAPKGEPW